MFTEELPKKADVVIIGCGVVGCAIARELSKYRLNVVAIEKEPDVGWGATRGNMGVIHPFVPQMKKLKGKMCIEGNKRFDEISSQLDVPFKRIGLLIVALNFIQYLALIVAYLYLKSKKIKAIWVNKKRLREMEPNISREARAAIFVPTAGMIDPVKYAIALAENAVQNGVKIVVNTKVLGFEIENNAIRAVITDKGKIETKFVINAAGLYSEEIERLAGIEKRKMWRGKGVMLIFDPLLGDMYKHLMAPMPVRVDPRTKGGAISITVDGLPIWGPNLVEAKDANDVRVTKKDIEMIIEKFKKLIPHFPTNWIVKYYAGVRPVDDTSWDFVIGPTEVKGFINAAYILSPGLTSAPVIAEKIVEILREEGLELVEKDNFNPIRKGIKQIEDMSLEELDEAIRRNPQYGNIVCVCQNVSEAEIREVIKRGARTIDSIKFRTRAGKGRCQGCRCLVKIIKILSEELGIPPEEVTLKGGGSEILMGD